MDAVGGAVSTVYLVRQFLSHVHRARWFQDEFGVYQLQLQVHLSRCARMISETNGTDDAFLDSSMYHAATISHHHDTTMLETLSSIQETLRRAQREAAQIRADLMILAASGDLEHCSTNDPRNLKTMRLRTTNFLDKRKTRAARNIEALKWAFYKKKNCDKFISEISAMLLHLERQVNVTWDARLLLVASPWHLHEAAHGST
ncbi:hypothetical protein M419DRAFT_130958 [Trichoderma reesei RUT C-30]|uniref:Prion-inhibition and propagation HeLo domain-containing protein n=1 Tax=Hypocrea jecorina (strain ATCC 56765 / BCRC 32924 / NRRL 11460 / Rut C-30) TaxID=1344414 RepID=A0A024S7K6_HYPJR|nr:hypothetical protein M419DRAFT_130958 [Trichoderma reesei RUT C-30]